MEIDWTTWQNALFAFGFSVPGALPVVVLLYVLSLIGAVIIGQVMQAIAAAIMQAVAALISAAFAALAVFMLITLAVVPTFSAIVMWLAIFAVRRWR